MRPKNDLWISPYFRLQIVVVLLVFISSSFLPQEPTVEEQTSEKTVAEKCKFDFSYAPLHRKRKICLS